MALFVIPPQRNGSSIIASEVLRQFAYGLSGPIIWAMMGDVADYGEWKTRPPRQRHGHLGRGLCAVGRARPGRRHCRLALRSVRFRFRSTVQSAHAQTGILDRQHLRGTGLLRCRGLPVLLSDTREKNRRSPTNSTNAARERRPLPLHKSRRDSQILNVPLRGPAPRRSVPDHQITARTALKKPPKTVLHTIRQCRNGRCPSPWSRPPRSLSQTSPSRRNFRRPLRGRAIGSANRRSGRPECRST